MAVSLRMRRSLFAALIMVAAGFSGLGYEIVWTQQCALWLGHEAPAVLAVVTAFFGGLGLGAWVLGSKIEASPKPAHWYAACEFAIAVWSVALTFSMPKLSAVMLYVTGVTPSPIWQWTVAFLGVFLTLLPATAAMGASLPAMERIICGWRTEPRSIAALYASNTAGAVVGVLATAFWLIPQWGLMRTAGFCIALNVTCSAAALALFSNSPRLVSREALNMRAARPVLVRLAMTGLLGIGYEVLVVRVLSEVTEGTVYTFAMLLAMYLAGTAAGATIYERYLWRRPAWNNRLALLLAFACLLGTGSLWWAEWIRKGAEHWLGMSMAAALAAEALLALTAFGVPTMFMGALFSNLSARARAAGASFGWALGANTLGAAVAPIMFGVLALPLVGSKFALLLASCGYLLLGDSRKYIWAPAVAAAALAIWAPPLAFIAVPEGAHVVSYREGVSAAVSIVEDASGVAVLRINDRQQEGSSATLRVDTRQAWLPLLLHPAPKRVLFLGVGTGVTSTAAAQYPNVQVDAAELLPEVIAASAYFTRAFAGDGQTSRPHLIAADARRYVRATRTRYDVIVSDNFHPARSGSGALYTMEHFAAVRERLAPDGVFCQWLPLHQLDLPTVRTLIRTFIAVFPEGAALLANNSLDTPVLGLVSRRDDSRFDVKALSATLARASVAEQAVRFGIEDDLALFGSFVAGPESLRRVAADAELNTDDHPVVMYRAPRVTYQPDSLPRDRLIDLLGEFKLQPIEAFSIADPSWAARLAAYWTARNRFIETGRRVRPSSDVRDMLAQVREPLLSVLRISPDFRPAYDPLLRMAGMLAQIDLDAARDLLRELIEAQPMRPEASAVLRGIEEARRIRRSARASAQS